MLVDCSDPLCAGIGQCLGATPGVYGVLYNVPQGCPNELSGYDCTVSCPACQPSGGQCDLEVKVFEQNNCGGKLLIDDKSPVKDCFSPKVVAKNSPTLGYIATATLTQSSQCNDTQSAGSPVYFCPSPAGRCANGNEACVPIAAPGATTCVQPQNGLCPAGFPNIHYMGQNPTCDCHCVPGAPDGCSQNWPFARLYDEDNCTVGTHAMTVDGQCHDAGYTDIGGVEVPNQPTTATCSYQPGGVVVCCQ